MSSIDEFTTVFTGKPNAKLLFAEDVDDGMTPKKLGSWVKVDYLGGFHICCAEFGRFAGGDGWCTGGYAGPVTTTGSDNIGFYFSVAFFYLLSSSSLLS